MLGSALATTLACSHSSSSLQPAFSTSGGVQGVSPITDYYNAYFDKIETINARLTNLERIVRDLCDKLISGCAPVASPTQAEAVMDRSVEVILRGIRAMVPFADTALVSIHNALLIPTVLSEVDAESSVCCGDLLSSALGRVEEAAESESSSQFVSDVPIEPDPLDVGHVDIGELRRLNYFLAGSPCEG